MSGIYLLSGCNLGDRMASMLRAIELLEQHGIAVKAQSNLYETAAWGQQDQPAFLNQVIEVATSLSPHNLLTILLDIESALGRKRNEKWGPRTLDLDLLYYGDSIVQSERLTLPHPQLHLRRFTLVPLCEIAPLLVHPLLQKNNLQLLEQCPDQLQVVPYEF